MEEWQQRRCLRSGNGKLERFRIKLSGGVAFSIRQKRLRLRPVNSRGASRHRDRKVLTSSTHSTLNRSVEEVESCVANFCESYAEFCSCRLKSRAGKGFCLTLTFLSAKIRPLFTVVFSHISRDCGDGFVAGRRWRFLQIRIPRYHSQAVRWSSAPERISEPDLRLQETQ